MALEFRVLGPLEVRRDGVVLSLGGSKARTLLAALLVDANRVVSADGLIETLWPDAPPANARHALEAAVSRLRSSLGGGGAVRARPPGYLLELDPEASDAIRFRRLLAEADDLVRDDAPRAASRVDDALALWRGPPYAEFAFDDFARDAIAELSELHLHAEELRIDAALAGGGGSDLVGEVASLVAAEPTRERRREQQILALYRAGRQADALAAYREARTFLRDELGLEPGERLRDLERAILRQDTALSPAAAPEPERPQVRRPATAVVVEPDIPLDLDPEEHERRSERATSVIARVGAHHGGRLVDRFALLFLGEDHGVAATAAAAELADATASRVGTASGDVLVGAGTVGGPLLELARRNVGSTAAPPVPALVRRLDGPFLGREADLQALRAAAASLVLGPPGIGKSRLLRELARDARVVVGRCSAYGQETLAPLHEIAAALGRPGALAGAAASDLPLIFRRLCESAGPVTIAVDDLHWAYPNVVDVVEHVAERAADGLRLVCLARDELLEERPTVLPGVQRLHLSPLTGEESAELARALGAHDVSVVGRAEGNPLFIEQLLAFGDETPDDLPSTLRSLLASRLDRLTPTERSAVECAAVAGREFEAGLVATLLEIRTPRATLDSLVRRGLLDPVPPAQAFEERYRFRHPLIHEAAYGGVPHDAAARLHEAVADALDIRGAADELIGFHLERAARLRPERDRHARQLAEEAGERLGSAGVSAWKLGDAVTGSRLLERAAALLPSGHGGRPELLCELGTAQNTIGRSTEADATFAEAAETGDRRVALRARLERCVITTLAGESTGDDLLELAEQAIPVFETVDDARSLGRALMLAGWIHGGALAQHAQWQEHAERALVQYGRAGWGASTCVGHVAAALYLGPAPVASALERCRTLLDSAVHDHAAEAAVTTHLGGLHAMAGDFADAHELLRHGRALYEALGRRPSLRATCNPIEAAVARLEGDVEAAAALLEASCSELVAIGDTFHVATQAAELAEALLELGRVDAAESWCATAERHARRNDVGAAVVIRRARALLGGDVALAEEALQLADGTDALNLRAATYAVRAQILQRSGRRDDAAETLAHARQLYVRKGNTAAASRLD